MARSMTKQMEALRLIHTTTLSDREIALAIRLSKTTVGRYRRFSTFKKLSWDDLRTWSPAKIDAAFNKQRNGNKIKPPIDYPALDDYLAAHKMPLQVWWESYSREQFPQYRSYSNVSAGLRKYRGTKPTHMHMIHVPGQKVFVDFSGERPHYIDVRTRQRVFVEVFVGTLGASSYTFVKAIPSQQVVNFIRAHAEMFTFFGGVTDLIVPDNLKSAMDTPGPDGDVQRGYEDLNRHYGSVVIAARPYRPKDKGKVERHVEMFRDRILSRLRTFTFYSIDEINERIAVLLEEENDRPMGNGMPSRRQRFEAIERAKLKPLNPIPYEYAVMKAGMRVDGGYHILIEHHRYSVPHSLIGQRVDARITDSRIEVFHEGRCVANHPRSSDAGGLTTDSKHQPDAHRAQAERTPEKLREWARTAGPTIHRFVEKLFNQERPYLGLRPTDTLKTLAGKYGTAAVEQALASYPDLDFARVSNLRRTLSIQAKEGASPAVKRSTNARGARSYAD